MTNLTIVIEDKTITAPEFNDLACFISSWNINRNNKDEKVRVEAELPLFLKGPLDMLSETGMRYFKAWHKAGAIRNMRVIK